MQVGQRLFWILAVVGALAGCDVQVALREMAEAPRHREQTPSPAPIPPTAPSAPPAAGDIRVASFNVQVFGLAKLAKPEVVGVLVEVVRRFDVVAIQEIRSKEPSVLPRFVAEVNAQGRHYDYVIGPRLGRTSSKEQYAFVYDTDRLEVDSGFVWTVADPEDRLHREPFVARFCAKCVATEAAFSFTLVNIHTDPDEVTWELDALADVFRAVQQSSDEDDVILLGDLNADASRLGRLGQIPNLTWVVAGQPTNTRGTASYDNLLFDREATAEFTGYGGVLDLITEFQLTPEQALAVSDHLPVWASFRLTEKPQPVEVAERLTTPSR